MKVGILDYGIYVPKYRIKVAEIAPVWGKDPADVQNSLGVKEKSVSSMDEDAVTLAFEAANSAILSSKIDASQIDVCFVGSESHPYAVNPTSTIISEFLNIGRHFLASDLQFACKAATTGMIAVSGMIASGQISTGLIVGTDCAQAKPHDILEYTAASAAAAVILTKENQHIIAEIVDSNSYTSDTPDFWRRDGIRFPSHGGRFTGEPAYFAHVLGAAKNLLVKTKLKPEDFDYCVFHMPNGKFPRIVAKRLGFSEKQLSPSLIVEKIGNPYSASSLLGLTSVLDIAKPNKLIFMVSYGSGAGSDGLIIKTTANISTGKVKSTFRLINEDKQYISYIDYLKFYKKI